jgi:hypothetical protein
MLITFYSAVIFALGFTLGQSGLETDLKSSAPENLFGEIVDQEFKIHEFDFAITNSVLGEAFPRVCNYQKNKLNFETPVCVLFDLDKQGKDPLPLLLQMRDGTSKSIPVSSELNEFLNKGVEQAGSSY